MQTPMTDEVKRAEAKREIKHSLKWGNFCTRMVGVDFYEEDWHLTLYRFLVAKARIFVSTLAILWIGLGEFSFIIVTMIQASRIDEVVVLIHLWAYVLLSISKMMAIWGGRGALKKLLTDLEEIWPVSPLSSDEAAIKEKSLVSLSIMHSWYFWLNFIGVCSYILTPIVINLYQKLDGQSEELGLPWMILYPYDIHAPGIKAFTYAWEGVMGFVAVFTMVGPDLLVTALASHVGMLMRLLNLRLRTLAPAPDTGHLQPAHHYQQVVECIKLHQKLIGYCQDIEDTFSFAFLVNIVLSSVNICCSGFICVLLEPLMNPSNKVYLVSSLYQIGLLCWYGDDIHQVSGEVSEAAYAGGWYRCDSRSRHALRFLMQRSQKRLTFTAMKFKYINLVTYTSMVSGKRKSTLEPRNRSDDLAFESAHSNLDHFRTKPHTPSSKKARSHNSDDLETVFQDRSLPSIPSKSKNHLSRPSSGYHLLESSDEDAYDLEAKSSLFLPRLSDSEEQFLQLVADGDVTAVREHIRDHRDLNVNCVNFQGLSALHLAVANRSEAMVEFLLSLKNIVIADTVLHAVRDNQLRIMKMLLDAQTAVSPGLEFVGTPHSTDFPQHVTPLMLAAQCGHYEAVALLVERGHRLERPHPPNCTCAACKASLALDDPLQASSARLALYRAIASPAYIVHATPDPVLAAFRLSAELDRNAAAYRQLAVAYLQLRDDVSAFAVELIGCCRSSDEMELVMRQTSGSRGRRHFIFPRLLMAVDYKQKEFVAHPNTQQVLESYWLGDWYGWRGKSSLVKAGIVVLRVFITPAILVLCMVLPRHRLVRHWQIPLNKLITHAAAYFVFLITVFIISNRDKSDQKRGPPNTGAEGPLIAYVCGYTWSAVRMCVMQGPRRFFTEMWNWGEIVMLALFGITFILWAAAAVDVSINDKADLERKYWNQFDPTLLAEGSFCVATIIAYFRLMFLCQLNYHLGPLQVSLGKMTIDIYKYIIVFTILISAFAVGLARLYQYYDGMIYTDEGGMKTAQVSSFTSLSDTLNTLFWALFCMAPIESADVVLENSRTSNSTDSVDNRHAFTEKVGYLCFACFEVISVIVVLNMLIATMSNTFQRVTDNVAIEWTFGRTEVYVDYISQTTLPSPYNLIPTASGLANIMDWFRTFSRRPPGARAKWSLSYCCYIERDIEENRQKDFPLLMSQLVQRYFRDKESSYTAGGGLEGEVEGLRREIAALKTLVTDLSR